MKVVNQRITKGKRPITQEEYCATNEEYGIFDEDVLSGGFSVKSG